MSGRLPRRHLIFLLPSLGDHTANYVVSRFSENKNSGEVEGCNFIFNRLLTSIEVAKVFAVWLLLCNDYIPDIKKVPQS